MDSVTDMYNSTLDRGAKFLGATASQSKPKDSSTTAFYVLTAFLAEGYFAKSFIFSGNDPTMLHYALSTGISLVMGVMFCLKSEVYNGRYNFLALGGMAILWSFLSSYASGFSLNYVSSAMFGMMILSCYFWAPFVYALAKKEPWRHMMVVLAIPVVLSLPMMVATPDLAYDSMSGRFQGAFISVAVACNIFFYVAVFAAFAAKGADSQARKREKNLYLLLCALSLFLLYVTRTRSLLVNALICIGVAVVTTKEGKIILPRVLGVGLITVAVIVGALLAGIVSNFDFDTEFSEFRLDKDVTSSRDGNWSFGIERIQNEPMFGEGLLAKQNKGGKGDVNLEGGGGSNYDTTYDPHSLVLSLGVQSGIPFMIAVMSIVIGTQISYFRAVGLNRALATPEFVIVALMTIVMIPAGGDLTSFGNLVDRMFWMLLGSLGFQAARARRAKATLAPAQAAPAASAGAARTTQAAPARKMEWGAGD